MVVVVRLSSSGGGLSHAGNISSRAEYARWAGAGEGADGVSTIPSAAVVVVAVVVVAVVVAAVVVAAVVVVGPTSNCADATSSSWEEGGGVCAVSGWSRFGTCCSGGGALSVVAKKGVVVAVVVAVAVVVVVTVAVVVVAVVAVVVAVSSEEAAAAAAAASCAPSSSSLPRRTFAASSVSEDDTSVRCGSAGGAAAPPLSPSPSGGEKMDRFKLSTSEEAALLGSTRCMKTRKACHTLSFSSGSRAGDCTALVYTFLAFFAFFRSSQKDAYESQIAAKVLPISHVMELS
jgi:hypothetical protein